MRIKNVIIDKGLVKIKWESPANDEGYNGHSINVYDEPQQGFVDSISDLKPHLISIWEGERLNPKLIHVTGLSIVYVGQHQAMSVKIIGNKTFNNSPGSTPFVSPAKEASNPTGKGRAMENLLGKKAIEAVNKVIEKAEAFLKGDRAVVVDMFAPEPPPEETKKPDSQDLLDGLPSSKVGDNTVPFKKSKKKAVKKAAKKAVKKSAKTSVKKSSTEK